MAKSQEMCCRNGPQVRKLCFTLTYLLAILLILKNVLEENSISLWIHYHELVENGRSFLFPKSCILPAECMNISDSVESYVFLLFTISGMNSTSRMPTLLF